MDSLPYRSNERLKVLFIELQQKIQIGVLGFEKHELYASLADRSSAQLIRRLCRYDVLLIDELGYLTLKPEQVNAFFKLMGERYGKKSTVITSNLDYAAWYDLFQRKTLVDALLDRLKHYCITIRINGPSLRVASNGKGKSTKP